MTSTRAYRKALGKETAIAELHNMAGEMWDPQLVDMFIEMIESDSSGTSAGGKIIWQT